MYTGLLFQFQCHFIQLCTVAKGRAWFVSLEEGFRGGQNKITNAINYLLNCQNIHSEEIIQKTHTITISEYYLPNCDLIKTTC